MAPIRRIILWLAIIVAFIAALIYGGHLWWLHKYGSASQPIPSAILDVDKSFKNFPPNFPPDPGEAGKKTIHGIDADHDGVRDDVQRWIYAYVPNEPKKQMALRQLARYFQQYALADNYTHEVIIQSNEPLDRAIQCIRGNFGDNGYTVHIYLKAKILNTFSRVKRYWDNDAKITTMEMAGDYKQYESPCENQ